MVRGNFGGGGMWGKMRDEGGLKVGVVKVYCVK